MKVDVLVVGYLQENCYIITIENESYIIDPGDEYSKILDECKGLNIKGILVTHFHPDHVGALSKLEEHYNLKANKNTDLHDMVTIKNPGHTSDSVSFYFPKYKIMFTGDFIFYNSIGRMDLPTGSEKDMINSLEKISKYEDDILIYPGHGPSTYLGDEKKRFKYYF